MIEDFPGEIEILDGTYRIPTKEICKAVYAKENDVVILGGTLVEGIGNIYSDIDVYVFVDTLLTKKNINQSIHTSVSDRHRMVVKDNKQNIFKINDYCCDNKIPVDTEYWTFEEVLNLLNKCNQYIAQARQSVSNTFRKKLSIPEVNIMHQAFVGLPLKNIDRFSTLMKGIAKEGYCYYAYCCTSGSYSELLDIAGAYQCNDLDRAYELSREFMLAHMQGFTHLNLNTNMKRKWLITYVKKLPSQYGEICSYFFELIFSDASSATQKKQFIFDCLSVVDKIFKASHKILAENKMFPSPKESLALIEQKIKIHRKTKFSSLLAFRQMLYTDTGQKCADFIV